LEEVRAHSHVLTPGRYVGAVDAEDDEVPFTVRFAALQKALDEQFREADALRDAIQTGLTSVVVDE
jgi:type I restriction enzyme M protein